MGKSTYSNLWKVWQKLKTLEKINDVEDKPWEAKPENDELLKYAKIPREQLKHLKYEKPAREQTKFIGNK